MNDVVVVGLGNLLMSDEGIGVAIIEQLRARDEEFPGVDLLDAGTSGASMLHLIAGRRKAVIVDCACLGEAPGTLRRFTPDQVRTQKELSGLSLHEADALGVIELSRRLGECPGEVVIFGIQPERVEPGATLSSLLQSRLDEYTERVAQELREPHDA